MAERNGRGVGGKASDHLADNLRERILHGEFPVGMPLPRERELSTQTGMSRTTVREALRILEAQGLVEIRMGRLGGAYVLTPGEASVADSVNLVIRGQKIRIAALLETREAIEPQCASLAARYRTDEDLAVLDAANRAIEAPGSLESFLRANVDWHVGVAQATHNELLSGFMGALSAAIYDATDTKGFVDEGVRTTTARAHKSVTRAIRQQDAEAAARRMQRHVHEYAKAVLEVEKRTAVEVD